MQPSDDGYRERHEYEAGPDAVTANSQGTFTILFTDLEGSTDLRVRVGDAAANEIIRSHDELIRSQLEIAGGVESKSLGDGFMALFTSANQAIAAAVSIQKAIEERNQFNPEAEISVRMGLNSGDVTQSGGDAHGTAVHAAARVAAKAQGGQILVSQIVHDLAGTLSDVRIVERGLFWLKGFPDRWRLYEVLWRDKESSEARIPKEVRAASAAAFDLDTPRSVGPVVGREREEKVIRDQLEAPGSAGLRAVVLEGEAGIGKTKMLQACSETASQLDNPYWVLDVSADEELQGPFLLFRSMLTSPRMAAIARQGMALEQLDRAQEAIAGRGPRDSGLSPQEQMLRTFDEVASVVTALTRERPLALMFDDLQWADEDSIQLIRYLVRTLSTGPIFLLISLRPFSDSSSGGAGKLKADLDRLRVTHVLRLQRLTKTQTGELLKNLLGAPVADSALSSLHARSEGVPFFIEELARAYREAEALQLMDGTWTMTKLSGPTVPSSIHSLIERRLAQLTDECRALLADAGVLGRRFRLSDLSRVVAKVEGGEPVAAWKLGEGLQGAVDYGLISELPESSGYDFSFSHDQIRASLLDSISRQRRRAIHGAIAEALAADGAADNLSMLAYHSLKSGDQELAVSSAIKAARAAMGTSAHEESIRIIDAALTAASKPEDRIEMLRIKDDALAVLDRGMERVANLAEMTALTHALTSPALDADVKLRRASAARANGDTDLASGLAGELIESARAAGDQRLELAASLELGQALTGSPIGESYWPLVEIDFDGAEKAFSRALELAREVGARSEEADALRELAVIEAGRVKFAAMAALESGASRFDIMAQGPELFAKAKEKAEQAFHIYEELGDRRGSMSSLISMAYAHITDPTAKGIAGRIEHIRALHHARKGEVTDSQRAIDDALMLYSIQTYARLSMQPDLALERGQQGFDAARSIGDRWLECLAAGGLAMTHLSIGGVDESAAWLDRAANAAMSVASPSIARRMEMWRGAHAAARGDVTEIVNHYGRAAELAGQRNQAGRCEAHAALAIECARIGVERDDAEAKQVAQKAAGETLRLADRLPGNLPWQAVAHAALAVLAQSEGDADTAAEEARAALEIEGEDHIEWFLHVLWAAGRTLITQGEPEAAALSAQILGGFSFINMSISDPDIKARWFAVPARRELAEIVGFDPAAAWQPESMEALDLTSGEVQLLRDLAMGSVTARHRAGAGASASSESLAGLFAKLGVESETEAIEFAIKAGITWQ